MKVGVVVEWLDASRGGAETSTGEFIDGLVDRGVEVEVFTRSASGCRSNVTVHEIPTPSGSRSGKSAEFLEGAERATRASDCDLVHAFVPCRSADIYQPRGGLVAETIERTVAVRSSAVARLAKRVAMAMNRRQRMVLARERAWLTGPDKPIVIAISQYVARQLRDHYNYPDSHIRHVFNGVRVPSVGAAEVLENRERVRSQFGIRSDAFVVVQVCHNFKLKGVRESIGAIARLCGDGDCDPILMIVGRGVSRRWEALVAGHGVADRVVFIGPAESSAPFFHAADVLVHPTYYDPCSRVVLEAMSHGLPAITTRYDGAGEAIEDGVSGYVIDSPADVAALAERIRSLADPTRRRGMVAAARAAATRVSMVRHVEEVCACYSVALRSRGGSDE
jgi:UDP-glucose:(heptosyl)LPS alpha-1,3-glucosyltransferase